MSTALPHPEPDIVLATRLFDELKLRTGGSGGVTRASYGPGEAIAHDILRREAARLNLRVATDAACNLYMTCPGTTQGAAIFIGSHLDSVPLGGNFDGAAGVLLGLSVLSGYRKAGVTAPRDITLMAIRAEESTWFGASYIGSRAALGLLKAHELDDVRRSSDGLTLGAAIEAAGGDPQSLRQEKPCLAALAIGAFIEPHIEQGPSLIISGKPIGIVTGIRGSFRFRQAVCHGVYAHSGATPRSARKDAVRAVARLIARLDAVWEAWEADGHDLAVTFGQIATDPAAHAFSKVAGKVSFSLDVRSQSPRTLEMLRPELARIVLDIETQDGVTFDLGPMTASRSAEMHPAVIAGLETACADIGTDAARMPCGAGHDAAVFAQMGVPTGMLFIRNENGSHNPDERMDIADFAVAARVLSRYCLAPPEIPE